MRKEWQRIARLRSSAVPIEKNERKSWNLEGGKVAREISSSHNTLGEEEYSYSSVHVTPLRGRGGTLRLSETQGAGGEDRNPPVRRMFSRYHMPLKLSFSA